MKSTYLKLEINISVLEGKKLPEENDIVHRIMEHLDDLEIEGAAVVDVVHITEIDGRPTNQE